MTEKSDLDIRVEAMAREYMELIGLLSSRSVSLAAELASRTNQLRLAQNANAQQDETTK